MNHLDGEKEKKKCKTNDIHEILDDDDAEVALRSFLRFGKWNDLLETHEVDNSRVLQDEIIAAASFLGINNHDSPISFDEFDDFIESMAAINSQSEMITLLSSPFDPKTVFDKNDGRFFSRMRPKVGFL
eukprot:CAMPEP_0185757664 /NCGR_PEP_ID=MMETSP1174-20130828/16147_1 /TAXON_ID=35687 /ORGANISM="Dictyocha speculum, Strain CCMP1381" /LENGTH=128 /DNA_ID=CAMNT_0028437149 /DNA_START=9 /DNA_END=392 /DNA_ORIENTATION=-